MGVTKLIAGIAIMVLNIALAAAIPNFISSLPQNTIELIQLFIAIMAVTAPVIGFLESDN